MNKIMLALLIIISIVAGIAIAVRLLASSIEGANVTSWWRSWTKNESVGGLAGSAHLIGWAADIVPVSSRIENAARRIFPVVVNEGDHIHVSVFRA